MDFSNGGDILFTKDAKKAIGLLFARFIGLYNGRRIIEKFPRSKARKNHFCEYCQKLITIDETRVRLKGVTGDWNYFEVHVHESCFDDARVKFLEELCLLLFDLEYKEIEFKPAFLVPEDDQAF